MVTGPDRLPVGLVLRLFDAEGLLDGRDPAGDLGRGRRPCRRLLFQQVADQFG
jgi:hypothetical protein